MFPLVISASGIVGGIITLCVSNIFYKVDKIAEVEKALKGVLIISTILETPLVYACAIFCLPDQFLIGSTIATPMHCSIAVWLGLWSGLVIGFVTEYYTSFSYSPVRNIAKTQATSAATGIIYGLAVGYLSVIVPVICLAITILVAHTMLGMYGVALGALGMLSTLTMGLTIDAYGPISDNAGGIAEMSGLSMEVRKITDALDAAGNTTAAIGKGFAIGSAALVSLALFGAFCVRAEVTNVNILNAWTFTGLLMGAMMPYAFAAMTMKSVGVAAKKMVEHVRQCLTFNKKHIFQLDKVTGEVLFKDGMAVFLDEDDVNYKDVSTLKDHKGLNYYEGPIKIATDESLNEMIAPGALVMFTPIIVGWLFGVHAVTGLLAGGMTSGVQMAISQSNTGGAWDNVKKWVEKEKLLEWAQKEQAKAESTPGYESKASKPATKKNYAKGSECHKASVVGDTVGDPLKDTSGPALNILMKLMAIVSLVFAPFIVSHSICGSIGTC